MSQNRQWVLKQRPTAMVGPEHFELLESQGKWGLSSIVSPHDEAHKKHVASNKMSGLATC
jgi:hypothetical protein